MTRTCRGLSVPRIALAISSIFIASCLGARTSRHANADDVNAALAVPPTLGGAAATDAAAASPEESFVYVGGYGGEGESIRIFRLDLTSGELHPHGSADGGTNPSYLAFHPTLPVLYALNETAKGRVVSLAIDSKTGGLSPLNDVETQGSGPAHLRMDRSGRWLLVAHHGSGSVVSLPVDGIGAVDAPVGRAEFGAHARAHFIMTDPANRHAFVPCNGHDSVESLLFDAATGVLMPNDPAAVQFPGGVGARHMDFHPNGRFAYLAHEAASTVTTLAYVADAGRFEPLETHSTLPADASTLDNTAADIHVHPSGRFVYASNRGHDSIVQFAIDEEGRLRLVGHSTGDGLIDTPRSFHIEPSGRFLLVASQGDEQILVFRIDATDGRLELVHDPVPTPGLAPSFVGVFERD
jgi:6-phosphogluconolactonase